MLEAEYADGYIHRETEEDISPYERDRNYFYDILHKLPEKAHGKMVRFAYVTPEDTYSIDWTQMPDNARPIRYTEHEKTWAMGTNTELEHIKRVFFGYQFTDENGKNIKEITEVTPQTKEIK